MVKIGYILMLEPKYPQQKEKFNCMVVEMGTGCVYTDFPINLGTGQIASLMDGTQFNVTFSSRLFMYSIQNCLEK
ncbi:protein YcgR [Peribacillus simplex]|uniref:Protein YcgR n=1 Tax=Peribacillus simplex TaxID=1478 RepID=A0A9X8R4L0_9BACI|nr:flagellar brake domain-containing protein [Peribacillus simplex]SIQ36246.1 protein YcgR [Peribacillus simplex]